MEELYIKYKSVIMKLLNFRDIPLILKDPLKSQFEKSSLDKISREVKNKVEVFFEEFDKIVFNTKYLHFIEVSTGVSDWISELILAKDNGHYAYSKLNIICGLINENVDFYVEHLKFNKEIIEECLSEEIISMASYELLLDTLEKDGLMFTKYKFLDIIHVKSYNCYSKYLFISYKYNNIYLELFCESLHRMLQDITDDKEIRNIIQIFSNSIIDERLTGGHLVTISTAYQETTNQPKINNDLIPKGRAESIFKTNSCNNTYSNPTISSVKNSIEYSSDDDDDESLDFDQIFGANKNSSTKEMLNFQPEFKSASPEVYNIRQYQEELAEYGIAGKNVLICAPTGSGKTMIAIKIVEEHFKSNLEAKVIFIVPTNSLVEQQYKQFHKYLHKYKILQQSGSLKPGNVPFSLQIPNNDIFIVTCDILKNMLESTEYQERSLTDFTLVIFDECHHCYGSHSYNKVMDYYFNIKNEGSKPQIVGMTASTGTDKAKSMESAMNTLYNLCANLDCQLVATVKLNLENLTENLNCPSEKILTPGYRNFDEFEDGLLNLIRKAEARLLELFNSNISIPENKWHDKYLNFTSNLPKNNFNLSDESAKEIRNLSNYLSTFHRALFVNNLFTSKYARFMIEKLVIQNPADFERNIQNHLKTFLSDFNLFQDKNPSLECLKQQIKTQFKSEKQSRIIIFVKEIYYAKFMEEELNNSSIENVKCANFVGTNKTAEKGGNTNSLNNEILKKFLLGKVNVICCTSKPEEGLDIDKCNLVVRYGYVTNEISRVQSKGRARAKNSQYLVIVPYRLEWQVRKESINKFRETMMYKAIEKFQSTKKEINAGKIESVQKVRRSGKSVGLNSDSRQKSNKIWDILCSKCEKYLCDSSDIRVVNGNSYVVMNEDRFCNLIVDNLLSNSSKVLCSCSFEIGVIQKHLCVPLPVLKIKKILFKSENEKLSEKCWKDVPFKPIDATPTDFIINSDCYRS